MRGPAHTTPQAPPTPRGPRPPAAGAAARTGGHAERQTDRHTDRQTAGPRGASAISPLSAMAEPAAQSPLVSSSSPAPPGGPWGGSGAAICADPPKSSSSSFSVSLSVAPPGPGGPPPDSPESPFELVPPGPPFWGERELLSRIPEDRICHFPAPGARPQAGPGRPRGTAAALEEVSRCVREMQQFTAQLLRWDALGGAGDPNNGNGDPNNGNGDRGDGSGDPKNSNGDPKNGSGEPNNGTGDPADGSGDPKNGTGDPNNGTSDPNNGTGDPNDGSGDPNSGTGDPGDGEGAPPRLTGDAPPREHGAPPRPAPLPRLPGARELVLWREPRRSGAALALSVLALASLGACSAVSVLAHAALALLSVTISLRVCRGLLQALNRGHGEHPFRAYLDLDLTLTPERFEAVAVAAARELDRGLRLLLRLFLVHDLVDSLKLAVAMWLLTYVGAVFNGITLLILAELLAFTLPPLYERYKAQIDHSVGIARQQIDDLVAKVQAKLPALAKTKPQ